MITLQDAKNRFSALVDAALAGRPQEVSRRGKLAVVILAADEYRRLVAGARAERPSFAEHLMSFPAEEGRGETPRAGAAPRDVAF